MIIKAIIFDLWGTLIFSELQHGIAKKITRKLNLLNEKEFWHIFGETSCISSSNDSLTMFTKICNRIGIKDEKLANELASIWNNIEIPIFSDTIPTLEKLKEGKNKLGLISNTEDISAKRALKKYNLKKYFDAIAFSYEIGLLKPNIGIFQKLLDRLKIKPFEACIVDDSINEGIKPGKPLE